MSYHQNSHTNPNIPSTPSHSSIHTNNKPRGIHFERIKAKEKPHEKNEQQSETKPALHEREAIYMSAIHKSTKMTLSKAKNRGTSHKPHKSPVVSSYQLLSPTRNVTPYAKACRATSNKGWKHTHQGSEGSKDQKTQVLKGRKGNPGE